MASKAVESDKLRFLAFLSNRRALLGLCEKDEIELFYSRFIDTVGCMHSCIHLHQMIFYM